MKKYILFIILSFLFIFSSCGKKEEDKKNEDPIITHDVFYYDGVSCINIETVNHGESAKYQGVEKPDYEFLGWDKDLSCITEDVEVNAIYKKYSYIVTFVDKDNKTIETQEIEIHGFAKVPQYSLYGYDITWDHDLLNITSDVTIKAVYTPKKFCVKFYGLNDVLLDTQYIDYLSSAIEPNIPNVDRYQFNRWDTDFCCIEEDTNIYAQYIKITGLVSFTALGNKITTIDLKEYTVGTKVSLPDYQLAGYDFIGWRLSEKSLTLYDEITPSMNGDYVFEACLVETTVHSIIEDLDATYKITNVNKNRYTNDVNAKEYKLFLYSIDLSSTPYTSLASFNWSVSDSRIAKISEWGSITALGHGFCYVIGELKTDKTITVNCLINCSYDGVTAATLAQANAGLTITATFVDDKDNIIDVQKVPYNGSAVLPPAPVKTNYIFNGWDHQNYGLKEDVTFKATYKEGTEHFAGKSFAIIGDSISTWYGNIPDGYSYFYPYPTADLFDINQTWWKQTINALGGTLFIDNSYSGSCVVGTSSSAASTIERLQSTLLQGEAPDVILIYMGSNDIRAYPAANFRVAYRQMIKNLKSLCPNSEIILMELPTSPFYTTSNMNDYNNVINEMGKEFDLYVVETHNVDVSNCLVDSVHPLFEGHTLLANYIIEELRDIDTNSSGWLPWV